MGSRSAEDSLPKQLGGGDSLKSFWIRIVDDVEYSDRTAGISYVAVIRRRDENVLKSGTLFLSGNLRGDNQ